MSLRHVRLESVALKNLRDCLKLDLDFSKPGPYVIIGRNGTCKTTVLRVLAGALGGERGAEYLINNAWPLRRNIEDQICIDPVLRFSNKSVGFALRFVQDYEYRALDSKTIVDKFLRNGGFVAAYGVSRFFSGPDSNSSNDYSFADATATLFNLPKPLTDPELSLRRLKDFIGNDEYARVLATLKKLVGLSEQDELVAKKGGGITISGPSVGGEIDFSAWADGYRLTTIWLLDLFSHAMKARAFDEQGQIDGVVLIDEIEQHLHPSMQLEILPRLQALLPKCQIIVTTHSPLVALSVPSTNVISLKKLSTGEVVRVEAPDFKGYSAEDVLTHPNLFDAPAETQEVRDARKVYVAAVKSGSVFGQAEIRAKKTLSRRSLADIDPELSESLNQILAEVKGAQ